MITRRDALKLAAASAAAAPFAAPPARAAALLGAPAADPPAVVGPDVPPGSTYIADTPIYDPAAFAGDVIAMDRYDDLWDHVAPAAAAEYKQQRQRLAALVPSVPLLGDLDNPWWKVDEAVTALTMESFEAGIRAGAAAEHLRLALVGPARDCRACEGRGFTLEAGMRTAVGDGEVEPPAPAELLAASNRCPDCGGRGVVPTPAPVLAGFDAD
jgi:hypothetical protein